MGTLLSQLEEFSMSRVYVCVCVYVRVLAHNPHHFLDLHHASLKLLT